MNPAVALALALLVPAADHHVVCHLHDSRVTEASSLVDLGRWMVTANDSGGAPVLFVVDGRTGRTVGTTTYASKVSDVEALAPAGEDRVWVGDIGDNTRGRGTIAVYRVGVGPGARTVDAPRFELAYPDGAHDAEALVARRGRLYVVTKALIGAAVYAAPRHLSAQHVNRMRRIGPAPAIVTDAALLPGGQHVVLRTYHRGVVETFPGLRTVGTFALPHERLGEAVSVGPHGRIRITSEGTDPAVVQVALPDRIRRELAATPGPRPSASPTPSGADRSAGDQDSRGSPWPLVGLAAVIAGAAYGLRRLRRHLVHRDR